MSKRREAEADIKRRFLLLKATTNTYQQREFCATEAVAFGWGGVAAVYRATGIAHSTIIRAIKELQAAETDPPRNIDVKTMADRLKAEADLKERYDALSTHFYKMDIQVLCEQIQSVAPSPAPLLTPLSLRKLSPQIWGDYR